MVERPFAEVAFEMQYAQAHFEDALVDAGIDDFTELGWDDYDCSLEIYGVPDNVRLNEAQQKLIFDAGFATVYVNHKDGSETHYNWHRQEFKADRGWHSPLSGGSP